MPEAMSDFIFEKTGHRYELSYVRKIMKRCGYVMKVAVLRHARRPGKRRLRRFQKSKDTIEIWKAKDTSRASRTRP